MATQSIAFNGTTFSTKKAATDALRQIVADAPRRTWLTPTNTTAAILLDAIARHSKWGARVHHIRELRVESERGDGLAVRVRLDDGTEDKVGWTRCFAAARTDYSRVIAALRHEVRGEIQSFRHLVESGEIAQVSAISGTPLILSGARRFHVDHTPAFADTVEAWAPRWGGVTAIAVHDLRGGGTEITDDEIADDWFDFHHTRHNRRHGLRAITREENLALGRHDGSR